MVPVSWIVMKYSETLAWRCLLWWEVYVVDYNRYPFSQDIPTESYYHAGALKMICWGMAVFQKEKESIYDTW